MKDLIPGGLADNKPDKMFSKEQLNKGIKVEREHTSNKELAKEIAKDHLMEDSKYYDKLETIEKKAGNKKELPLSTQLGRGIGTYLGSLSPIGIMLGAVAGHKAGKYMSGKDSVAIPAILSGLTAAKGGEILGDSGLGGMFMKNIQREHSKNSIEKKAFWEGFSKEAMMEDTDKANSAMDAVIGYIPLGTTVSTAFGKRPEGHGRLKEWGHRVLGGLGGALVGSLPGVAMKNRSLLNAGALGGALGGEYLASKHVNKKYYDEKGDLKKEYTEKKAFWEGFAKEAGSMATAFQKAEKVIGKKPEVVEKTMKHTAKGLWEKAKNLSPKAKAAIGGGTLAAAAGGYLLSKEKKDK